MMFVFIFLAGSLATAAAVLLLLPLLRRRTDGLPASGVPAAAVAVAILLGGVGLYAAFSKYDWGQKEPVGNTPAARAALLAQELAASPNDVDRWLQLGGMYMELEQFPLAERAYQRADRLASNQNPEAIMGLAEAMLAAGSRAARRRLGPVVRARAGTAAAQSEGAVLQCVRRPGAWRAARGAATLRGHAGPQSTAGRANHHRAAHRATSIACWLPARSAAAAASDQQAKIAVRVSVAPELAARVPARIAAVHCGARSAALRVRRSPRSACRRNSRWTWNSHPRTPCSNRAASAPDSNSKWWRAWRWAALPPRPAATRSDKLAIMWARTGD